MPDRKFYERVVLLELKKLSDYQSVALIMKRALLDRWQTIETLESLARQNKVLKETRKSEEGKEFIVYKIAEGVNP